MDGLDRWDFVLLGAAAMIAVRTLIGLMRQRRDRLVREVQEQIDAQREEMQKKKAKEQAAA